MLYFICRCVVDFIGWLEFEIFVMLRFYDVLFSSGFFYLKGLMKDVFKVVLDGYIIF